MPTFQSHKIHASKSSFISCQERGIYLDLQNSLPEGQWSAWLSRKFFPSNGQNSSGKNWTSLHWNSNKTKPMKATKFCWRKNLTFFFSNFLNPRSVNGHHHPSTNVSTAPVGPSSLLHVRLDPLPFWCHRVRLGNRGRIQQNTAVFSMWRKNTRPSKLALSFYWDERYH